MQSPEALESFLDRLRPYGRTTTSMVLSVPVSNRIVTSSDLEAEAGNGSQTGSLRSVS